MARPKSTKPTKNQLKAIRLTEEDLMKIKKLYGSLQKFIDVMVKMLPLIILISCGSMNVSLPTKSEYAPKGYNAKGTIKYLNQGADFVIAQRKEDAFKQMSKNCNANYKINYEGPRQEGGMITSGFGGFVYNDSQYWYIDYECLNQGGLE